MEQASLEELIKKLREDRAASTRELEMDPAVLREAELANQRVEGKDTGTDDMSYPSMEADRYNPSPAVQEALRQLMVTGGSAEQGMADIRLLDEERNFDEAMGQVISGNDEVKSMPYEPSEDEELGDAYKAMKMQDPESVVREGELEMGPTEVQYNEPESDALGKIGSEKEAEMLEKLKQLKK